MRLDQLTRSHEWWDHKTPQVLSLAYATALLAHASLFNLLAPGFLVIFGSLILIAVYASIINDFTDLQIDLACGKSNMMEKLTPIYRILLVLASLGFVLTAAFFIYRNVYGLIFYLLIAVAISLYSFKPIRLKNRAALGVIACASAEHLFPTLFGVAVIAYYSGFKPDAEWLIAVGILSLLWGVRSILWHQFLDYENDRSTGVNTYATGTNPKEFHNKAIAILAIELLAMAAVLLLLKLILPVIFLLLYVAFITFRKIIFHSPIVVILTKKNTNFQILMLGYYSLFFPLCLLIYAAFTQSLGWVVLLIHIVLFYKPLLETIKEILYLSKFVARKIIA